MSFSQLQEAMEKEPGNEVGHSFPSVFFFGSLNQYIAHLVISRERPRTLPIWIAFRSSGSQEPAVYISVLLFYCYEFSNQLGRLFYRPEF